MYFSTLTLDSFKNYEKRMFRFSKSATLVGGDNAAGKTNILEAIHILARGESFRAQKTEEMIRFGAEFARITGGVGDGGGEFSLETILTRGELTGRRVAKRRYSIDGVPKRYSDFVGKLAVV